MCLHVGPYRRLLIRLFDSCLFTWEGSWRPCSTGGHEAPPIYGEDLWFIVASLMVGIRCGTRWRFLWRQGLVG